MAETEPLGSLAAYDILESPPEAAFDRVVALAADLFDAPIAAISFIDGEREWFKARLGLEATEVARADGLGQRVLAMRPDEVLVADGAPAFPGVRFYVGLALINPDGCPLGVLCIMDDRTRPALTAAETRRLRALGAIAVDALELRRASHHARDVEHTLDRLERVIRGERSPPPPLEPQVEQPRRRAG